MLISADSNPAAIPVSFSQNVEPAPVQEIMSWSQIIHTHDFAQMRLRAETGALEGINAPMSNGVYPLTASIRLKDSAMVKELMKYQADPTLRDHENLSAYDYAILTESKDINELLFPAEASEAVQSALKKTKHIFLDRSKFHAEAEMLQQLRSLIADRVNKVQTSPKGILTMLRSYMADSPDLQKTLKGLHGVLTTGNLEALQQMPHVYAAVLSCVIPSPFM